LRRAGLVIITRKGASDPDVARTAAAVLAIDPDLPQIEVDLSPSAWTDLKGEPVAPPDGDMLIVASVADPDSVASLVRQQATGRTELLAYPDHFDYRGRDALTIQTRANGRTIVTTAKDAVKLRQFASVLEDVRVLHLRMRRVRGSDVLDDALDRIVERAHRS